MPSICSVCRPMRRSRSCRHSSCRAPRGRPTSCCKCNAARATSPSCWTSSAGRQAWSRSRICSATWCRRSSSPAPRPLPTSPRADRRARGKRPGQPPGGRPRRHAGNPRGPDRGRVAGAGLGTHSPRGGALRAARARVRYSRRDRHPRGARRRTAGAGAHRAARAGRRANLKHGSCVTTERILEGLARREPAALARAITLVENQRDGFEQVLSHAHGLLGRGSTRRVGITGPPGAGKSTLTEALIQRFRARRLSVGVVAVDPTSPFTGGALLGDRIRMESVSLDPGVFIRSMATRGAQGGLATTTEEVADLLEAFGFERVLIETVGVGQTELDVAATAETTVLVLVPESGDGIQTLKAGVMEIAELYVINKSDRPGADKVKQEVEVMLGIRRGNAFAHITPHHNPRAAKGGEGRRGEAAAIADAWEAPVITTVASKGEGIGGLVDALDKHHAYLASSGKLEERRKHRLAARTRAVVNRTIRQWVWDETQAEDLLARRLDDVAAGTRSPYEVAAEVLAKVRNGT